MNELQMNSVSLAAAKLYLAQMDVSYIIKAMCSMDYPLPRWDLTQAEKCAQLYKNFLFLQKKYNPLPLVPTREIDEFWHNHILHTKRYTHDCQQIFGHYLHHEPASADDNPEKLIDAYLKTKQLYLSEFGHPLGNLTDI